MARRLICAFIVLVGLVGVAAGQGQDIARTYVDTDGAVHVVSSADEDRKMVVEKEQVGCEDVRIAKDHQTVAWKVLYNNCCTSYSIPLKIVVYRRGRIVRITPPQMIWDWKLTDDGTRVAVVFGPVHGEVSGANLYNARTGRVEETWGAKGDAPKWIMGLRVE